VWVELRGQASCRRLARRDGAQRHSSQGTSKRFLRECPRFDLATAARFHPCGPLKFGGRSRSSFKDWAGLRGNIALSERGKNADLYGMALSQVERAAGAQDGNIRLSIRMPDGYYRMRTADKWNFGCGGYIPLSFSADLDLVEKLEAGKLRLILRMRHA